jgi:hypothetical protein
VLAELDDDVVARIAAHSATITLARREALAAAPSSDIALLAVEEGFVVISADVTNADGDGVHHGSRRIVLATGESGALLPPPAPGEQLEAVVPCRITAISADSLTDLLRLPLLAEAITNALAAALAERDATIRNCAYVRHSDRVREKLLQLARTHGRAVPDGVRIDFPLTHQLLADMVGSARETVGLAISEFVRAGFALRQQRRYVLRIEASELFLSD